MSRLFVLILPLALLWWAFRAGEKAEPLTSEEVVSERLRMEAKVGRDQGLAASGFEKVEGKLKGGLERLRGERLRGERLRGERLERGQRLRSGGVLGKMGEDALVDEILAKISPGLLKKLPEADRAFLRSYISDMSSADVKEKAWLCWGPEVSQEKAEAFLEAEKLLGVSGSGYRTLANQFLESGGWNRTAMTGTVNRLQGTPTTVTWSIVPDGTGTPGLEEQGSASSDFRSWMASIYGGGAGGPVDAKPWFSIFRMAFEAMGESCGVTLIYEPFDDGVSITSFNRGVEGVRGDIRISARALDGDSGTLAFAYAPDNGDIIFDSADSTFDNTSSSSLRLYNTVAHELGHSLGLDHVCPRNYTKLMEPILATSFRGPRFDEYQSLQRLYGDFLESDEGKNSNDTVAKATGLDLVEDENLRFSRLSIDDNLDRDYFKVEALRGQKLTVTVKPGEGIYLEGGDNAFGCSQGVEFDSSRIHDLSISILDSDGATVLMLSDEGELGEFEVINQFEFEEDGTYYVKIHGDSSNAAQLYHVDFLLGDRSPEVRLVEGEEFFLAESGSVKNGNLDANETIKVSVEITNEGVLETGGLSVVVTGSENVTVFSSEITAAIGGSETGALEVVFGAEGECGDVATLSFEISDESGPLLTFERDYRMGLILRPIAFEADFDASADLPEGWTTEVTGGGVSWDVVTSRFVSPLGAIFSPGLESVSDSILMGPSFELAEGGGTLSFEHWYELEAGYDGGVLEFSRNEGVWLDLIESPMVSVTGGYDREILTGYGSAIAGQKAWTAERNEFMTTEVVIPSDWAGDSLRFRWRLVHDSSASKKGWWIDNVKMVMAIDKCELHRPVLNLVLEAGDLDENRVSENAVLRLSSELPLLETLGLVLISGGDASGADYEGDFSVAIGAGEDGVSIPFWVLSDDLTEGEETLTVTIPDDQAAFTAGELNQVTLTIVDRFSVGEWLAQFFTESVPLTGDSDGDGQSELAEYLLGTDPTSGGSRQAIVLRQAGDDFLIPLSGLPDRSDATLGVEFSGNLMEWVTGSFVREEEGLKITPPMGFNYIRLTFSLDQ